MNEEKLLELSKNVDHALSGLHTLILAYGFNCRPMKQNSKELLPGYASQISDMLYMVKDNLTDAKMILKEAQNG